MQQSEKQQAAPPQDDKQGAQQPDKQQAAQQQVPAQQPDKQAPKNGNTEATTYKPGFLFYDAMELQSKLNGDDHGNTMTILKSYGVTADILDKSDNPYIDAFSPFFPKDNKAKIQGGLDVGLSSAASSVGGLDVTNFADGLAKFLVERTQQELSVAFFQKMKEQFGNLPEFRIFFPSTYKVLNAIETYQYASILQTLKESFEADIRTLPLNLPKIRNFDESYCNGSPGSLKDNCDTRMTEIKKFFDSEAGNYTGLGLVAVENIMQGSNPADVIDNMANSPEMDKLLKQSIPAKDCGATILLGNLISQSLLSKEDGKVWVTSKDLKALFGTTTGPQIYLALLYQKYKKGSEITFYDKGNNPKTFGEVLTEIHTAVAGVTHDADLIQVIKTFSGLANNVNSAAKKLQQNNSDATKPDFTTYYNFFQAASSALTGFTSLPVINKYPGSAELNRVLEDIVNPAVDMTYNIATKNYSAAILNLDVFVEKSGLIKNDATVKGLLKYGTFISTVATAQNSDQVKKAIEAVALPVGSASIKKKSVFSVSLNAYVAPFLGQEYYQSNANQPVNKNPVAGLYAPVGIGLNWGLWRGENHGKDCKGNVIKSDINNAWSFSLFIPIIDVGAVVAYRFQNDTMNLGQAAKIRLGDIFSPGGNFVIGFPRVPISLGVGCNWLPTLAKLYTNQAPEQRPNGYRVFAYLGVDLPVVHFSRKGNE